MKRPTPAMLQQYLAAGVKLVPLAIAAIGATMLLYKFYGLRPHFEDLVGLSESGANELQKLTLNNIGELNKFMPSLATLMFGAVAFYVTHYTRAVSRPFLATAVFLALILIAFTYVFAFKASAELTAEIAQGALGLRPGASLTFFYLEMEFWSFLVASVTMLSIFAVLIFEKQPEVNDRSLK
jgi:hypothetical protein